jgi:hypothetical protein
VGILGHLFRRRPAEDAAMDLRRLPAVTCRVRGLKYHLDETPRAEYQSRGYLLVRETENAHDKDAIAVYSHGVRIGFVAASRAGSTASLLDQLSAPAFRVNGRPDGHGRVIVEMPTVPSLRELVADHAPPTN